MTGSPSWAVLAIVTAVSMPTAARAQQRNPAMQVGVRAVVAHATVHPGDMVLVVVDLTFPEGFHAWPHEPVVPPVFGGLEPIPTDLSLTVPPGASVADIQWPEPTAVEVRYTGSPVELLSYTGRTVIHALVTLASDQPEGSALIRVKVSYQACDATVCYPPVERDVAVPLHVVAPKTATSPGVAEPDMLAVAAFFVGSALSGALTYAGALPTVGRAPAPTAKPVNIASPLRGVGAL